VPVWNQEQLNSYLLFIKGLITVIAETGLKKLKEIENRKRIQKSEEDFAAIFAMSLDMICIADINTATFVKVNPAFTEILGYGEEELLEKSFLEFVHPEDIHKTRTVVEQKLKMGAKVINFENRYRCKDGTYRWLSWVSHPNTKKGVTFAVARDVTELKRNEAALKKSKAILDATGRMAKVGGWELDAETLNVTWTEETYRIHEVPLDYKPPLEGAINFFHPEDRERLSRGLQRALDYGEPYDMELRFITAKGNQLWTRTICQPEISNGKTVKSTRKKSREKMTFF
jgi:PAS domain S-box-containing protein